MTSGPLSAGQRAEAAATRTRLAEPQAPGAHRHLIAAIAPANPLAVAGIAIRRQLAEYLAALQRGRARPGPPHAALLTAATITRLAALNRIERGGDVGAAPAPPEPNASAAILKRDEIAEGAAGNVAIRRKRPFRRQGGTDTLVHDR